MSRDSSCGDYFPRKISNNRSAQIAYQFSRITAVSTVVSTEYDELFRLKQNSRWTVSTQGYEWISGLEYSGVHRAETDDCELCSLEVNKALSWLYIYIAMSTGNMSPG